MLNVILFIVLGSHSPHRVQTQQPNSRTDALRILKGCATRPITSGCSEDTAVYLIDLYEKGDRTVLKSLLDAGRTSDGALSEVLGDFYADILVQRPRTFLEGLRFRPKKEQGSLCWLAAARDGSGMGADEIRDVRRNLTTIISGEVRLAPVARICLREVNKVRKRSQ
jgi:hypothetical protein